MLITESLLWLKDEEQQTKHYLSLWVIFITESLLWLKDEEQQTKHYLSLWVIFIIESLLWLQDEEQQTKHCLVNYMIHKCNTGCSFNVRINSLWMSLFNIYVILMLYFYHLTQLVYFLFPVRQAKHFSTNILDFTTLCYIF